MLAADVVASLTDFHRGVLGKVGKHTDLDYHFSVERYYRKYHGGGSSSGEEVESRRFVLVVSVPTSPASA